MELYGWSIARNGSQSDQPSQWFSVGPETTLQESMRRLGLWSKETYPERSGAPDCSFYMRTGSCGYGAKCRFNHPPDRTTTSVGESQLGGSEYPERIGEPTCQETRECSYYLKTGQCKFGVTCKFHHPYPAGVSAPAPARPFYPTVQSLPSPPEEFNSASTSFSVEKPPLLPGSCVPGTYGPLLLHPGLITIQNWSTYSGPVSPSLSPSAQHSAGVASIYGISQLASSTSVFAEPYSPLHSATGPSSSTQKEKHFPERPDQPVCQYYMKTGDGKFESSCRYHRPPDWIASKTNCSFSSLGLPLRPGVEPCSFYMERGFCKFDHPMKTVECSPSTSSLPDTAIALNKLGSSFALAPTSLPEFQPGFVSG